jgi:hypothetical protein
MISDVLPILGLWQSAQTGEQHDGSVPCSHSHRSLCGDWSGS